MAQPAPTQVMIVAAYPAVRAGLISLIAADESLAPIAPDTLELRRDGLPRALPHPPNSVAPAVIVADLSGIDDVALDEIRDAYPDALTILIGGDPNLDGPGLAGGAVAYLGPEVDGPMLIAAVHGVLAGLTIIDPAIAGAWLRPAPAADPAGVTLVGSPDRLTDRERQVLELVASGLPNKAIARELGISEHTVKFHVGSLLGKLGAGSRTEAVTLATRRGLLTI
ncbi:MAG: response regulator transcription factor [Chloroflexota bacterium]|nr:response regulator transcription factor [Chloroflexota bacterium]